MPIPSSQSVWMNGQWAKAPIYVLAVRHPERPDAEPVAWVLVERRESYQHDPRDNSIHEASIRLSYQRITDRYDSRMAPGGYFSARYRTYPDSESISLTGGAVFLDLPGLEGHRIGTYLMNEIVTWTQRWPDATVKSIHLVPWQASKDNKERCNRFYEQFGLVFDYTDPDHRQGQSPPRRAKELTPVETWKANIAELNLMDYLSDAFDAQRTMTFELQQRTRAIKELVAEQRKAEAHPVRWMLYTLYAYNTERVVMGALLMGLAALIWLRA